MASISINQVDGGIHLIFQRRPAGRRHFGAQISRPSIFSCRVFTTSGMRSMGLFVPAIAWIEEAALIVLLALVALIGVGALFWWIGDRKLWTA